MSATPTHKAIQVTAVSQKQFTTVLTPTPTSGQALIRPINIPIMANMKILFEGGFPFPMSYPYVPGTGCIGRVEAVGPDAALLQPGDLVYCDPTIWGRDDPKEKIIHVAVPGLTPNARRINGAWVDGFAAELAIQPLESCVKLDEQLLVKEMGYSYEDLYHVGAFVFSYHGLRKAKFTAGDTVIVAWATGRLANAAVELALALGARRVIALGRSADKLATWLVTYPAHLQSRIRTYAMPSDPTSIVSDLLALTPNGAGADVFFDMSPMQMVLSGEPITHLKTIFGALAIKARVVFMGGIPGEVSIPYGEMVKKDLSIVGGFMYDSDVPRELFKLVEAGVIDTRSEKGTFPYEVKSFEWEEWDEAVKMAHEVRTTRFQAFVNPPKK